MTGGVACQGKNPGMWGIFSSLPGRKPFKKLLSLDKEDPREELRCESISLVEKLKRHLKEQGEPLTKGWLKV